jgi:hypothetical protein
LSLLSIVTVTTKAEGTKSIFFPFNFNITHIYIHVHARAHCLLALLSFFILFTLH